MIKKLFQAGNVALLGACGAGLLAAAVWVAWGFAPGLAATGAALIALEWRVSS